MGGVSLDLGVVQELQADIDNFNPRCIVRHDPTYPLAGMFGTPLSDMLFPRLWRRAAVNSR